jgi:hypothetical protein
MYVQRGGSRLCTVTCDWGLVEAGKGGIERSRRERIAELVGRPLEPYRTEAL